MVVQIGRVKIGCNDNIFGNKGYSITLTIYIKGISVKEVQQVHNWPRAVKIIDNNCIFSFIEVPPFRGVFPVYGFILGFFLRLFGFASARVTPYPEDLCFPVTLFFGALDLSDGSPDPGVVTAEQGEIFRAQLLDWYVQGDIVSEFGIVG